MGDQLASPSSPPPASPLPTVVKLRGGNYPDWKFRMQMRLVRLELWEVVSGADQRPQDVDGQRAWDARSLRALAEISDHVGDTDLVHIRRCTRATEAWLQLTDIYEPSGLACQVFLNREFRDAKMREGANPHEHFAEMRALKDQLETAGQPVPDSEYALTLLASLPKSFEPLVREISMLKAGVTPTLVISTVIQEYERRQKLPPPLANSSAGARGLSPQPQSRAPTPAVAPRAITPRPVRPESDGSLLFATGDADIEPPRLFGNNDDDSSDDDDDSDRLTINPFEPPRLYPDEDDPTTPTANTTRMSTVSTTSSTPSFIQPPPPSLSPSFGGSPQPSPSSSQVSPRTITPLNHSPPPTAGPSSSASSTRSVSPSRPDFRLSGPYKRDEWYLYSAGTHHVTPRRPLFSRFEPLDPHVPVLINGVSYEAEGQGDIHVVWDTGTYKEIPSRSNPNKPPKRKQITHRVLMRNVRYVPTAPACFVAISPLTAKGIRFAVQPPDLATGLEFCLMLSTPEKGSTLLGRADRDPVTGAWRLLTEE